jgi:hypothetical protein
MAETAARLVDGVLPRVPVRQWVLSLPRPLRYRLAYDARLASAVLAVFLRAVFAWLRRRAKRAGIAKGQPGAVTFLQRFGSAINLNLHFHSLILDGVYTERDGKAVFRPLPPPLDRDILALCKTIARRTTRVIARLGLSDDAPDPLAEDEPLLAEICAASIQNHVTRVGDEVDVDDSHRGPLCADVSGFNLQAAVVVPANDRSRLERLVRYVARPPIAAERLSILSDDRIAYEMKKRWRDGTTHVVFGPDQLVERLIALIPAPRKNLVRYHGVLASRARLRPQVVAQARRPTDAPPAHEAPNPPPPTRPGRYMSWADLLRRVFEIDVLCCPRCGGRMKIVATLTDRSVVAAVLRSLGVSTEIPRFVPARSPPADDECLLE